MFLQGLDAEGQNRLAHRSPGFEFLVSLSATNAAGEAFHCFGPQGIEIPINIIQTDRGPVLRTAPIPEPGFYRINAGPQEAALSAMAVNVDTRESDLRPMSAESANLVFGSEATILAAGEELSRQVLEARHGIELWRLFLALALVLLLVESLVARGRTVH